MSRHTASKWGTAASILVAACASVFGGLVGCGADNAAVPTPTSSVQQTNLVSSQAGQGAVTVDPNLLNAWGIAYGPTHPFWVVDNASGKSTLYDGAGVPEPAAAPLVVTIPPSGAGGPSLPTGIVANGTGGFNLPGTATSPPFIFDSISGTIAAWAPPSTTAAIVVDNSAQHAVYTGLALASNSGANLLYAANASSGRIDVFDSNYAPTLPGSFVDSSIPAGFGPYNIVTMPADAGGGMAGNLLVTYANQTAIQGAPGGYLDLFSPGGALIRRVASNGTLNSPWGVAIAPPGFGNLAGNLLVGNLYDGHISVFNPATGIPLGLLRNSSGQPVSIDKLWALIPGGSALNADPSAVYFTAGPMNQTQGLFGKLNASVVAR